MKYFFGLILSIVAFFPTVGVAVVSHDFTFKMIVGDDVTPPGTPTLLSVEAMAASQIDVVWSAVTDNFLLGGYVLLRDGTPVATTTLTSFSDTGLSPSTVYAYEVYAFDSSNNISSTSNSLATTTFALPPVATSTESSVGGQESTQVVVLKSFAITPQEQAATIAWSTNIPARFMVRWGRTDEYAGGYITNETYQRENQTTITDLEPGTVYRYELIGYTPAGIALSLQKGEFSTLTKEMNRTVPNVERLSLTVVDDVDAILRFTLPPMEEGARVRIVRSHVGFPTDVAEGAVVYEGIAETFRDNGIFRAHERVYYTVFVIGHDGTVSSGAVVVGEKIRDTTPISGTSTALVPSPVASPTEPEILLPLLRETDIVLRQDKEEQTFLTEKITLSHRESFTLSIARAALPPHLKSIIVTLLDPTDQRRSYSFLLRINKAGTAYEATIAPLLVLGTSRLEIEVYDFERKVVGRYRKQIDFVSTPAGGSEEVVFPDALVAPLQKSLYLLLIIACFTAFGFFIAWWRRRAQPEDKP